MELKKINKKIADNFILRKVIFELLNNFKDHITKINDNKNPGKTPNSFTIKPDNQAPISLYKFVGVLSETTPQPLSAELKVSIIVVSDIEENNNRIDTKNRKADRRYCEPRIFLL